MNKDNFIFKKLLNGDQWRDAIKNYVNLRQDLNRINEQLSECQAERDRLRGQVDDLLRTVEELEKRIQDK